MFDGVKNTVRAGRRRAAKLPGLDNWEIVTTSTSQVFFAFALTLILLYGWAEQLGGDSFSSLAKIAYGTAAIVFLVLSFLAFERVRSVDFWDFIASILFTGELRKYPHGKAIDLAAAQLYFGLVLVAFTPVLVKYYETMSIAAGILTLGGLLVATGVAVYVLSGSKLRP